MMTNWPDRHAREYGADFPDPRETDKRDTSLHPNSQSELDRRLDRALEDTFPASDPIAIVICSNR